MAKRRRNNDGLVFSTNSSMSFDDENQEENDSSWTPADCKLYVSLDRKQRAGKPVTIVEGFNGPASELLQLGKDLKVMCGVGGTVKEGCVLIQGDQRDKVVSRLEKDGYLVKLKGG
ncbi:MAG: translation initiation factor [Flavobacteriales bacterium]|jgi:translation initiation factor 1|nr:translation initiation factor [Flavobacteriales bacterium]